MSAETSSPTAHHVLIAEDDEGHAAELRAVAESRGDVPYLASTVEEALALIAQVDACYYLVDQQLPLKTGHEPMLGGGERVLRTIREKDARRQGPFHVTPVLVVTSYSGHEDFVGKMYDLGASGFMSKPIRGSHERLLDKIRTALERGGRAAHAGCAALAAAAAVDGALPAAPPARGGHPLFGRIAAAVGAKEWSDIEVSVIDGHTIRVQGGKTTLRLSFLDIGFGGADRNPIDKWRVVEGTVSGGGIFRGNRSGAYESARNAVCVAQILLKAAFGLPDNPFHRHKRGLGWKAKFVVRTRPDDGDT